MSRVDQCDKLYGLFPSRIIGLTAYIVGWCWPFVMAFSGVGVDRYHLALSHKLLLTALSLLLPLLIAQFGGRSRLGCAAALGLFCGCGIMTLWFWN